MGAQNARKIEEVAQGMDTMEDSEKCELAMFCRLDRTCNTGLKRITMAVRNAEVRGCINQAMEQVGWIRKFGRAPPSHMEREMQQWVEALIGEKSGE